jgi:hypothetical protein
MGAELDGADHVVWVVLSGARPVAGVVVENHAHGFDVVVSGEPLDRNQFPGTNELLLKVSRSILGESSGDQANRRKRKKLRARASILVPYITLLGLGEHRALPWTLFDAKNASSPAEFLPFEGFAKRSKNLSP